MRKGSEKEPQPQLQAWLQQEQGLSAADADRHARRLALVFGSQQAALDSLPATFEWCNSRGLSGPQTAQLLDRIAKKRRENVVQFAALVQPVWQLMDSHIAAYVEPLRQAGARLPKHTSLAGVLCGNKTAFLALVMPPGHAEAWLAAVSRQLPAAALGKLLLTLPNVANSSPATASAAISWAAEVLGVADPAAMFARMPGLLMREATTLQRNLDSLQQALGWTAEAARQLVRKQPSLLTAGPDSVQAAAAWLRKYIPDAEQLADVISRGPQLIGCSEQHLQANADYLRQALGWQDGDGQLAAFIAARPQAFAIVKFSNAETQHKLRLLSEVVGVSVKECLAAGSTYLMVSLPTMAAYYMLVQVTGAMALPLADVLCGLKLLRKQPVAVFVLVLSFACIGASLCLPTWGHIVVSLQERAPHLLFKTDGQLHLSWIANANSAVNLSRLGMTRAQLNAFVHEWPRSEEGRRLLEGLRWASCVGWHHAAALMSGLSLCSLCQCDG